VNSEEEALQESDKLGYPVMLKATAGGGGMGLVVCEKPEDVKEGFRMVQSRGKCTIPQPGRPIDSSRMQKETLSMVDGFEDDEQRYHCPQSLPNSAHDYHKERADGVRTAALFSEPRGYDVFKEGGVEALSVACRLLSMGLSHCCLHS
jgi:hypothetical protein